LSRCISANIKHFDSPVKDFRWVLTQGSIAIRFQIESTFTDNLLTESVATAAMSQTVTDTTAGREEVNYTVAELREMQAVGRPLPDIPVWETYRVSSKVVDAAPPPKPAPKRTLWDRLKDMFKGPAVRAGEKLSGFEGKYYSVDSSGRTIETTVARTGAKSEN